MFLKHLEMAGFKSFPDKTVLKFESGITAIVGPNGCGKSNVFDGIRWVLGEQSTKALRSMKMEDVIFNGTSDKVSHGMAEVTLVFSNESRRLPFDNDEIEVCRRIFRSGESQYFLNKAPVRLKDILDLFMGTGIGAESYSLVEQGRIGLVLSTHQEERRMIFDEASGITKYKAQKKEALRKLEETEQNLIRINDIILEVRREINSLERQANKARRYKETYEELKQKEIVLARGDIFEIKEQRLTLINKKDTIEKEIADYKETIQDVQKQSALRINRIRELEKELSCFRDKLITIENLIANNTHRIQISDERVDELNSRISIVKNQLQEVQTRIEAARNNLDNFQKEYEELKGKLQRGEVLLVEKQKEYDAAEVFIKEAQNKIRQIKDEIIGVVSENSHIRNEIADLQALLRSQSLRKKRLDIEEIRTKEEKQSLQNLFDKQVSELDDWVYKLNQVKEEINKIKEQQDSELSVKNQIIQETQDLENEKIALQSQKEFLNELRLKFEGINQSLNAVLFLDKLPSDNISGIIIKVQGQPEYLENYTENTGNLKFKLLGEAKPMPLETQAIEDRINQIQIDIEKKQQQKQVIELRIEELNQKLEGYNQEVNSQEMLISNKNLQKNNLSEQLNKVSQEYEVISLEIQDLDIQIEQLNSKQTQLEEKFIVSQDQQKSKEETVSFLENSIIQCQVLREQNLVLITQTQTEIESLKARLEQEGRTHEVLKDAVKENEQLYRRNLDEIQESEYRIKQLSDEKEKLTEQCLMAAEEKEKIRQSQKSQEAECKELNEQQEQENSRLISLEKKAESLRNQIYELQMQLQEFDFKEKSIQDRLHQLYKLELEKMEFSDVCGKLDKEELSKEISILCKKLDSYGNVNLIAIEEYEELKKRYDFLTQQQNDLVQANQSLNDAISKINMTTRQMFLDAFNRICEEFQTYFRLLFGGGDGKIILTDESQPLESGIEIICRPPGKKLQNVIALSGGEKSLSAVALIFAIFKVKPAPFCVLDEIDAALDEINISRFSGILQEFAKISQFLVITHNKRTIANANVMYGITMQEPGISKIVSVKFSERQQSDSILHK